MAYQSNTNVNITGGSISGVNLTFSSPLAITNGGTGLTSSGSAGNVLLSNGTGWISSPTGGGLTNMIMYTAAGSSSFTVPDGVKAVKVTLGGGGGGGGASVGSAGGYGYGIFQVTPGSTITVTVGAGGAASTKGGDSSFGSYITAYGGNPNAGTTGTVSSSYTTQYIDLSPLSGREPNPILAARYSRGGATNAAGVAGFVRIEY
jgi:hypothetical protein